MGTLLGVMGEEEQGNAAANDGAHSPDGYEPPEGVDGGYTAYAANATGGASAWGGGQTPYGATPYGQGYGGY